MKNVYIYMYMTVSTVINYMASSMSRQDELNPAL